MEAGNKKYMPLSCFGYLAFEDGFLLLFFFWRKNRGFAFKMLYSTQIENDIFTWNLFGYLLGIGGMVRQMGIVP